MANTVNDVMNVIANPDYGIKNIAGTNQEILAILQGTHNSQNNIHTIVDDVKNLLQNLVGVITEKKSVEIKSSATKISQRHIQDILDETIGIRKAIDNLATKIMKQNNVMPTVAKLSDNASEKVAKAMVKNIEKQKKGGGMGAIIDAFTKLKNISLKDIIFGNTKIKLISKIFKNAKDDLKIKDKELNSIINFINAAPEMIKSLSKINWRINRIIKKNLIKKLSDLFVGKNSILSIANTLQKNKKIFSDASKLAKNIKELIISLNKAMKKLFFASLWAKFATNGIKNIDTILNKLIPITKKLSKNKKEINNGIKTAKKITALVGNLLITSIFLTIAAVTGGPAILGSILLSKMVDVLMPITKKLSKNKKEIGKSVISAVAFITFTGLMAISSALLATIAITGAPALLGSIFTLGIIKINVIAFKMLSKATKNILIGSISMIVMSGALFLFGVSLSKIANATKDISWKQFGMIAALTGLFGATIAILGIPAVFPFILLGSIAIGVIGFALRPFATTLGIISKATENMKMKQILLVSGAMLSLAGSISIMSALLIPVLLGSMTLKAMVKPLRTFAKTLKIINDLGTIPTKQVDQALDSMRAIGKFFKENALKRKSIKNAKRYLSIMSPFKSAVFYFKQLNKMGSIPIDIVNQTLQAMGAIALHYTMNPINKKAIKQAKNYKKMLRPFTSIIRHLSKLKKMGGIPMDMVNSTLNAMSTIANYYVENPINKKAIKQAKNYKKMLRPFSSIIRHLSKLKEIGEIPMDMVNSTLNAMSTIANYYVENPIDKKAIKQAKKYKKILKHFGETIKLSSTLKDIGEVPLNHILQVLNIISNISDFYNKVKINDKIEEKTKFSEFIIKKFIAVSAKVQDNFAKLKEINLNAVSSIVSSYQYINNYYTNTKFLASRKKILRMSDSIKLFAKNVKYIKDSIQNFTDKDYNSVKLIVKSMKRIIKFLKFNTLNVIQRKRVRKSLVLFEGVASIMSSISKISPSNVSSIGNAITDALSGVNKIDISQVTAVTNMFNAFNKINKSESIINKFTESVKEFTTACKDLMGAMGQNTDAINNIDSIGVDGSSTNVIRENTIIENKYSNNTNQNDGIRITNVDEIARTIAEKINGVISVDVPDTQVQLLINGTGGNEWTISRY